MELPEQDIKPSTEFEKNGWEKAAGAYHDHWGPRRC